MRFCSVKNFPGTESNIVINYEQLILRVNTCSLEYRKLRAILIFNRILFFVRLVWLTLLRNEIIARDQSRYNRCSRRLVSRRNETGGTIHIKRYKETTQWFMRTNCAVTALEAPSWGFRVSVVLLWATSYRVCSPVFFPSPNIQCIKSRPFEISNVQVCTKYVRVTKFLRTRKRLPRNKLLLRASTDLVLRPQL